MFDTAPADPALAARVAALEALVLSLTGTVGDNAEDANQKVAVVSGQRVQGDTASLQAVNQVELGGEARVQQALDLVGDLAIRVEQGDELNRDMLTDATRVSTDAADSAANAAIALQLLLDGKLFATTGAGLAGVADGAPFMVQGASGSATLATLYRRVGAAAVAQGLELASKAAVDSIAETVGTGPSSPDGRDLYALTVRNRATNREVPVMDVAGRLIAMNASGDDFARVLIGADLRDQAAISPGDGDWLEWYVNPVTGLVVPARDIRGAAFTLPDYDGGAPGPAAALDDVRDPDRRYTATTWTVGDTGRWLNAPADAAGSWIIHVHLGQSPAEGFNSNAADHPVSTVLLYPDNSWMLDDAGAGLGPRRREQARTTGLVPLIERDTLGYKESCCSGFANHLIRDIHAATGRMLNIVSIVAAYSSRPYEGLCRGQPVYNDMLDAVADAVTAIRRRGGRRIVVVPSYNGGESEIDGGDTLERSVAQLRQFARQLRADLADRSGSVEALPLFLIQPSHTPFGVETAWSNGTRFAPVAAHGRDGLLLAGPRYWGTMADYIHVDSASQYRIGQMLSRAVREELFGNGWLPIVPVEHWWTGPRNFTVRFSLPAGGLTLDTSGTPIATAGLVSHGFLFRDGTAPIGISTVAPNGDVVDFTLATDAPRLRPQLTYANQRNAGNTTDDGPVTGPRGTLRATSAHATITGGNQYDWAAAFTRTLT
jgi:hypothetical protein